MTRLVTLAVAPPVAASLAALLAGCAVGPTYQRPERAAPAAFKEAPAGRGWLPAAPADALDRGPGGRCSATRC